LRASSGYFASLRIRLTDFVKKPASYWKRPVRFYIIKLYQTVLTNPYKVVTSGADFDQQLLQTGSISSGRYCQFSASEPTCDKRSES